MRLLQILNAWISTIFLSAFVFPDDRKSETKRNKNSEKEIAHTKLMNEVEEHWNVKHRAHYSCTLLLLLLYVVDVIYCVRVAASEYFRRTRRFWYSITQRRRSGKGEWLPILFMDTRLWTKTLIITTVWILSDECAECCERATSKRVRFLPQKTGPLHASNDRFTFTQHQLAIN